MTAEIMRFDNRKCALKTGNAKNANKLSKNIKIAVRKFVLLKDLMQQNN